MVTFEGGASVISRTTDELPLFWICEPMGEPEPQPASAAQKISEMIGRNIRA
jgi:hypothetical protein